MKNVRRAVSQVIALLSVVCLIVFGFWLFDSRRSASEPALPDVQAATQIPAPTSQPYPPPQTPTPPRPVGTPTPRHTATATSTPIPPTPTLPPRATPNSSVPPARLTTLVPLNIPPRDYIFSLSGDYLIAGTGYLLNLRTGVTQTLDSLNFPGAGGILNGRWLSRNRRDAADQFVQEYMDLTNREIYRIGPVMANPTDRIGDQLFVFQVDRNTSPPDYDIYIYDIIQQKNFPLIVRPGVQSFGKIGGRWLVYWDYAQQPSVVRVHNLDTHEDFVLGPVQTVSGAPIPVFSIGPDYVVWIDDEKNIFDNIHIYNLARRQHYLIDAAAPKGKLILPKVSGDYLVYNSTSGYVIYDLKRNEVTQILSGDATTVYADLEISGNRIVVKTRERTPDSRAVGIFTAEIVR